MLAKPLAVTSASLLYNLHILIVRIPLGKLSCWLSSHNRLVISNNSYAHDDQGDNPGQENRRLNGVLYKLWPFVSDIAIFVLKRDVKLQLTN